ncbi:MAG: hypothetical protein K0Q67_1783 [Cellvibrio sp.]|nr:hypothetical protein [Cellvibrio sp.]
MYSYKLREQGLLSLLLLAYVVVRSFYLDAVPRWDAATYWGGIASAIEATKNSSSLTDLPRVILDTYNVFGHSAMGYVGLLVMGQLFDYPNLFILNVTHLLLATFSVFCAFKIFRWFVPGERHLPEVLLATAIFALDPLFFATSIFINTDFPVLVFFTAALAALLYGRYGWFAIASLFMIFSKATGTIFWISLIGGIGLYGLIILCREISAGRRPALSGLFPPTGILAVKHQLPFSTIVYRILCIGLPGIAFKLYTIAQQGAMWTASSGIKFDSKGWNCFGFNTRVMSNRAGEIFILNFHWVLVLIIVFALLIGYGRHIERSKKKSIAIIESRAIESVSMESVSPVAALMDPRAEYSQSVIAEPDSNYAEAVVAENNRWWGLLPVVMCFFTFVAFNLTYITYIIPRYVVYGGFFLILFALLALQFAAGSRKTRSVILAITFILFTAQTFRTIDPLSKWLFGSTAFSEHRILQIDSPGEAQGNGFVYNAEFAMLDKLLNRMQKAIPIKRDTTIITWDKDSGYSWFTRGDTFVNATTLERTIDKRNSFRYNVIEVSDLHRAIAPPHAIYIYMPWLAQFSDEEKELAHLRQFYEVSTAEDVGFQGYSLRLYRLTRLNQ